MSHRAVMAKSSYLSFDPLSPAVIKDPYPYYDQLRARQPVLKTSFGVWFLTRYEDVALVLRDRRFGKNFENDRERAASSEPVFLAMSKMLIYLDPPSHTLVRGLIAPGFSSKRVDDMRPCIQAFAGDLVGKVRSGGKIDLVRDFAVPLSLHAISEMLGIPEADRTAFFEHLPALGRAIDALPMSQTDVDEANARARYLEEFFEKLIDERRRCPGNDLISHLLRTRDAEDELTAQELISNVVLLFSAGHETTANLIGNSVLALHQHPQELARVRQDLSIIARGMDELIRYGASVQFGSRTALDDVRIGDKDIKAGDIVLASLGAANRDPAVFADPHRLDLTRPSVKGQSFGGGIHYCLGAQLARMTIEVALSTLFEKLPNLRLDELEHLDWKPSFIFRGLRSMPASC